MPSPTARAAADISPTGTTYSPVHAYTDPSERRVRSACVQACRCLQFLLAAANAQEQILSSFVAAGIVPILEDILNTYAAAVRKDAVTSTQCGWDRSDGDYDGDTPPHSHVPSGAAIVACSSLLQVLLTLPACCIPSQSCCIVA